MTKNILISGITGMLGKAVYRYFSQFDQYKLYGISRQSDYIIPGVTMFYGDLSSEEFVSSFSCVLFDSIVHCSAEVNVNLCEIDRDHAFKSNVTATKNLFSILKANKKIYISTDSIFDGDVGNYFESSSLHPLNYYAKTKLLGEDIVKDVSRNHYILRTNIYGFNFPMKKSLFEWAFLELKDGKSINGFNNMYFNPMYVGQLAMIIEKIVSSTIEFGIYNVASSDRISKFDFLTKIVEKFDFPLNSVNSVKFNQNDFIAKRALDTTLNNSKIVSVFKEFDFSIDAGISMLVDDYKNLN